MKVAFQGEPGAFSEEAGYAYFDSAEMVPKETFEAVFSAVATGECESGFIPIENSLAGSIHQNYDLLLHNKMNIVGEYILRVHHCLIGFPGVKQSEIKRVISHPQAIGQCARFLHELAVISDPVYDTAGAVKLLKASGDRATAAIASKTAAKIHEMQIIKTGIENTPENYTRFLNISLQPEVPEGEIKTSVVFTLKNHPGALYKALGYFSIRGIDLTKIESRPLVSKPWDYLFYIDFIGAMEDKNVIEALDQLKKNALMYRELGSYPRYTT